MEDPALWARVYDDLLDQVLAGTLPPAQEVPPTRELARRHNVSKTTARKARQFLTEDGYLLRVTASRYRVTRSPATALAEDRATPAGNGSGPAQVRARRSASPTARATGGGNALPTCR